MNAITVDRECDVPEIVSHGGECNTSSFGAGLFWNKKDNQCDQQYGNRRPIRKIEGFLCEISGDEATVCFVENDIETEMIIPAGPLVRNGITEAYQPFEFIESEVFNNVSKLWENITSYVPLCGPQDFVRESIQLSLKTEERLKMLLSDNAEN